MKRLLLLSGPMASGKTSVAVALQEGYGFVPISSSAFLREQLVARNMPADRQHLQELGDSLDKATDFSWLIESVASPVIDAQPHIDNWLLDAVRKPRQVELFKLQYAGLVRHVHITASESVLQQRYAERGVGNLAQYRAAVLHPNEQSARSLAGLADQALDIEAFTPLEIADQILSAWEK
ncbi:AAA family ATPase [Ectopseudomonas khazarica]|uniref:AAA family ATPase n=1 Tax=Ectopseudomonas khazarica TaxID=2502979 RepID=UPI002FE0F660